MDDKEQYQIWRTKAEEYLLLDQYPPTRHEIQDLVTAQDWTGLKERLETPLAFGTAGLRGRMGAGYAQINPLTIIQASQGLCVYLLESMGNPPSEGASIVIGHDHRHGSQHFAVLTAAVFLSRGFKVHFYSTLVHTPLVPFAVRAFGASAGIMITASHNPKQDNGYKVYWANGSQIIPPHDKHIASAIAKSQQPWIWDDQLYRTSPLCSDPLKAMVEAYFADIKSTLWTPGPILDIPSNTSPLKFCYTAMHGVGTPFAVQAFQTFGLESFIQVREQVDPDPDFPTVEYPNPEEGKGALKLAMETANRNNCRIILANDPDADRLAIAEKDTKTGGWKIFNGNEIGIILAALVLARQKERPDYSLEKYALLTTVVSGRLLKAMAAQEGVQYEETLTGFKWMGNAAINLEEKGVKVLFAFEEAIGFMVGTTVFDKDGISALAFVAQQAGFLYSHGQTLASYLHTQYQTYGYHISETRSIICHSPSKIKQFFDAFRYGQDGQKEYAKQFGSVDVIKEVCDLTEGYDSSILPDHIPRLPCSKSTQMLTFTLECGSVVTLRTSGTEPKVKCYCHVTGESEAIARAELSRLLQVSQAVMSCLAE